jgi:hypothetical protein
VDREITRMLAPRNDMTVEQAEAELWVAFAAGLDGAGYHPRPRPSDAKCRQLI